MDTKLYDAKFYINHKAGCLCRYVRSDIEPFRPHYHNYYELFLVVKGEACHIVNGKEQYLDEGHLLFIRDFDIHEYVSRDSNYFEFINLAFSKETFQEMLSFLGPGFRHDALLSAQFPPAVTLSPGTKEQLTYAFIELHQNSDKDYVRFKARSLLVTIFSQYFFSYSDETGHIPSWLQVTYEQMRLPQNFMAGAARMYELSGRSREHLTRCLKQYYHTTPTELVTQLRLSHAANLLLVSNLHVTDICYDCGFGNLSWFYKIFVKRYGVTPVEYRRRYKEQT